MGSFSAVSKQIFASEYAFCNISSIAAQVLCFRPGEQAALYCFFSAMLSLSETLKAVSAPAFAAGSRIATLTEKRAPVEPRSPAKLKTRRPMPRAMHAALLEPTQKKTFCIQLFEISEASEAQKPRRSVQPF